jgi:hypothetical protein
MSVAKTNRQLKATPEVRAGIIEMLGAGFTQRPIATRFNISTTTVYHVARDAGLSGKRHTGRQHAPRAQLPRCFCGLLLPCEGPHSAVDYSGRTREPEGHSTGDHFT